jgi:hypothetical protein
MLKTTLLAAALAAFPAAAEARDVIQPSTVTRSATIAGGATRTLELACRAPAIALNAAASGLPAGASVLGSAPGAGVLRWSLELAAAESAARQRLRASIRCLRLELPVGVTDVSLGAATRRAPELLIPAGSTRRAALRCQRGYIPTGYGLSRGDTPVQLAGAVASARGWSFRLANAGSAPARASLSIRCVRARVEGMRRGTPVSLRLVTRRARFTDTVQAGGALRHSCRAGEFSVAAGVSLDPAAGLQLESARPAGARAARWSFRGGSGRVETQLLCLARDSTFR